MSGHANDLGGAEGREAVHECDADVDFGGLAVRVPCGDALAECLETSHFRLDPASCVVSGPVLPERPAVAFRGAQRLVPGLCCWAVFLPRTPVLPDRNDWRGAPVDDGSMAAAGVVGTIGGHGANLFVFGDLAE